MSDYSEVQHGFRILQSSFFENSKADAFRTALDACALDAAAEAITVFSQQWENIQSHTYIASVSEHDNREDSHGRLSMWRGFGSGATRVALVLNIPWNSLGASQALRFVFSPVSYSTRDETHAAMCQAISNIEKHRDFLSSLDRHAIVRGVVDMLLVEVTCLKHEGFSEEREWRAIYRPDRSSGSSMESSTEVIGGVPQIVYKIPLDGTLSPALARLEFSNMFDRLIIGPSPYPLPLKEAFVEALSKAGVPPQLAKQRVCISGIPIRV
jgi:hypothetical protein